MGTWGVAILSDDLAKDVYDEFMEMYDDGLHLGEIRLELEKAYLPLEDDEEAVFYLALAKAQWECKGLDEDIFAKITEIVESETGMESWKAQGEAMYKKRLKVIKDFLNKLTTIKEKPRTRRRITKAEAVFEPGDCLTFKLQDGTFGGALVIGKDNSHKTEGFNIIALLDLKSLERPSVDLFIEAGILSLKNQVFSKRSVGHAIINCPARRYKKHQHLFERVGNLLISKDFNSPPSYCNWDYISCTINDYFFDKGNNQEVQASEITVRKLLGTDNNNFFQKLKSWVPSGFFNSSQKLKPLEKETGKESMRPEKEDKETGKGIDNIVREINSLIPELGGSIKIYGEWFGRPRDNYHKVVDAKIESQCLIVSFDGGEKLMVWDPRRFETDKRSRTFKIVGASKVRWEWFYYGKPHSSENLCFIEYVVEGQEITVTTNTDRPASAFEPSLKQLAVELC